MEKILLVLNARQPEMAAIEFGCRMAALTQSHLTGLFIENLFDKEVADDIAEERNFQPTEQQGEETAVKTATDRAVKLFVSQCAFHQIKSDVYIDKGEPIQEVITESRFADLLIVNPKLNFNRHSNDEQLPSHFTKEILALAECPVMLAPENDTPVEEIVFCYDGSASAAFALKQFTYLLPEFRFTKAVLLEAKQSNGETLADDHQRLLQWLHAHYEQVEYRLLTGNARDALFSYFFQKTKKLVVMGSYGRSLLSNFFRPSIADQLIRTIDLPLFITHYNR